MLSTLRSIVQELNGINNLQDALDTIAARVQTAMHTEVCSVYLYDDKSGCYVLKATEGLYKSAVGQVRIAPSEGLVGLVGTREEPINLEDAQKHPRNRYFPETGEERFGSFLGVPIIHHRRVLGVIVVQETQNSRRFDEGEEAFLVTISAQLAGVIAHSEATGAIGGISISGDQARDVAFSGVAGAQGVAIGTGVVVFPPADLDSVPDKRCEDVDAEIERFRAAVSAVRDDVEQVGERLAPQLRPEEQALFEVYLRMLHDHALPGEVENRIREGLWAPGSLKAVVNQYVRHFEMMGDHYLRERAVDIRDLGRRLLSHLQEGESETPEYPERTILVSDELTPAMLGEVPQGQLAGLVSVRGSGNSHVAILARAMGVPTVMGLVDIPVAQLDGRELIVDGYEGQIFASPSTELKAFFESIIEEEQELVKGLEELRDKPCETLDGHRIPLFVNTGLITDVVRSLSHGAEGIGLYRTEVPFMINERFPSEQEQKAYYREQLEAFAPAEVTMRTLDIGGDKALTYFPIVEENPFLGWRGIRVTLDHPEVFLVQIRAMIKASEGLDNLRIMLPMISNVSEIEEAQHLIYRAWHEVRDEGYQLAMPQVGVMIEIPAAVYQVREIAARVDFVSVGSNDLTQYLLAVDRNNPRVASLYHSYHPAVLQALCQVAQDCHDVGKPVSICGELAGDPGGAILLLAMGYDALSMNASNLPRIKSVIRGIDMDMARGLLAEVLTLDSPHVIRSCVELALRKAGIGRFIRPERSGSGVRELAASRE
ncbi:MULTISPECIES: phosphoenolpyruvate--protein phosphotransferase [Gammaproteobacteria]|uniref:phosphoenolpyruvate--protein phosphotransferase n=1 Tax=Vreelandella halophila TaxID=86177 RepID=A0A9X5B6Z4_9GAMM|nr:MULTISPECIES: phosphoenolpyruvate--protein phosphotransferase [Gammaproteobacteria]KAA8982622.1 phosphoenolpyruvate--protein phosphotransferase [Halospina sp. K52047b]MYL27657.1 phosphoenolpyruvate--protein phosphotransferase [Halomonas utahensis]MYL75387.1 phosphoenolpyruvate--protein phosphotransferase [Halomonas sp. 22501_18_FS]